MARTSDYLKLVKFSHTIFAMPFAMTGFAYAMRFCPDAPSAPADIAVLLLKVVAAMVFARNTAMGFNRWADRDIDKANPRTADREIPAGVISPRKALAFIIANALLFIITAATINGMTALLSPAALAVVMFYSLCKRFTALAHLVLGLSLAIAPAGAYIAVAGILTLEPCILSLLVMTWCAGFDIIYALQDAEFDRRNGLHSIPSVFTAKTALAISIALHTASIAALLWFASALPQNPLLWTGCAIFTAMLILQHLLVTPARQRNIGIAFGTLNGIASMALALFVILSMFV